MELDNEGHITTLKEVTLEFAKAPHVNLLTPNAPVYRDEIIEIYVQGIFGKDFVAPHTHISDKVTEIIIPSHGSVYGDWIIILKYQKMVNRF